MSAAVPILPIDPITNEALLLRLRRSVPGELFVLGMADGQARVNFFYPLSPPLEDAGLAAAELSYCRSQGVRLCGAAYRTVTQGTALSLIEHRLLDHLHQNIPRRHRFYYIRADVWDNEPELETLLVRQTGSRWSAQHAQLLVLG